MGKLWQFSTWELFFGRWVKHVVLGLMNILIPNPQGEDDHLCYGRDNGKKVCFLNILTEMPNVIL